MSSLEAGAEMAVRYYIDIEHAGLGKYERVQGRDRHVVERRAQAKRHQWDQQWQRQCAAAEERRQREQRARDQQERREQRAQEKEAQRAYIESRKLEAEEATAVAERAIAAVQGILAHTLTVDDRVNFDALKDRSTFSERQPVPPKPPTLPEQPAPLVYNYVAPAPSFWRLLWELLRPSTRARRALRDAEVEEAYRKRVDEAYATRVQQWRDERAIIESKHAATRTEHHRRVEDWANRKRAFEAQQKTTNEQIELLKARYQSCDPDAIEQYCDLVLSASTYPEAFPQTFSIQYRSDSKLLLVEYVLLLPAHMPKTKTVRYVQSRDELVESELAEGAQKKLYDSAIYQIAIRTLHELFEADVVGAMASIAFNGVVETIDGATGRPIRPCIISVQASKVEFQELNLAAVDPKACFRKLRGVGSPQLHALAPVPPLIRFSKDDVRFVDGRAVMEDVTEGQNIACMPWEDFEHLIRDLFEREFAHEGTDVRITRTSRDGGVDAVIFDPDPLRGGKLVVQAKRYTNTVGVAAVRDLYGAMTAERAAKGILVTTANFGHDSYEFAKDKPITLLDGGALLHLLQKHGVQVTIDLQQAKRVVNG